MNSQTEQSLESFSSLNLNKSILNVCLKMYSVLNPTGNQCFSPIGLHQLLSVLAALCQDPTTKRKLLKFLEFPVDTDSDELNSVWHEYLTTVRENATNPLSINFALFSFLNIESTDELGLIVKNMYGGDVLQFEDDNPNKQVDDWIDRATAGVIKTIQLNINPATVKTLLVSALHFKANWNKFLEWKILPDVPFHVDEHTTIKTNFLHDKCTLEYAEDSKLDLQAIKLDYENRDYYLFILLPKDLNRLEKEMTASADFLASLEFKYKYMSVYLPKFLIKSELDIMKMLCKIDPSLHVFDTGSKYGLYVTDIKQKNQIDVNEKGTEAASITCSMQSDGIGPKCIEFDANKPFVYLLCRNDTVLFTGRVCNPLEINK